MMRALWTASTGMAAQQQKVDVIANNLANVNTTGFKKSRADFQDLLYQNIKNVGSPTSNSTQNPTGIEIGLGVKVTGVTKNFSTGALQQTANPLDMAIEGDGFFQIQTPDGTTAYTRAGDFKKDSQGRLVTSDGYPLIPEIVIPNNAGNVTIGADGTVSVVLAGQQAPSTVGTIQLANFSNPNALSAVGHNLYRQSEASGDPLTGTAGQNGLGSISQGTLEASNVNMMDEMVDMISAQRAYEVNSKSIQASDEMLQQANNLKR